MTKDKLEEVKQTLGNLPLSEEAKQRAEKLVDASVSTGRKKTISSWKSFLRCPPPEIRRTTYGGWSLALLLWHIFSQDCTVKIS